jgi:hypothetical protein
LSSATTSAEDDSETSNWADVIFRKAKIKVARMCLFIFNV